MDEPSEIVAALARCTPFQDIPAAELRALLPCFRRRDVLARGFLWHAGDPASDLWFVLTGQLHTVMTTAAGEQIVTQVIGPGESFGEPALFLPDGVRITAIIAIAPSSLLGLSREALLRFLETHPAAMRRMLESMSRMILNQTYLYRQVAFHDMRGRVAYQLLKLGDEYGRPRDGRTVIPFKISQTTLAGLVAGTRESVNRALASLTEAGAICRQRGQIVIVDRDRLRHILQDAES